LGGLPTIIPSLDYRERFAVFMTRHFMGVCTQMNKKSKLTREEAKNSIAIESEDIDQIIRQSRKLEDIKAVKHSVYSQQTE